MVAPWVVEEEEKTLALCLVGFMKSPSGAIREVEVWLANTWGGRPISIRILDTDVVLLQLSSDVEIEGILRFAREFHSPFIAVERRMEVIGAPPRPKWIKFHGVPLQAWREEVFRLLGDVLGRTLEVDHRTASKEILTNGRVKIL